jgi:hypothetical protein
MTAEIARGNPKKITGLLAIDTTPKKNEITG